MPGTSIRFGFESLLRLIPGVGDAAASLLSCYLLLEAYKLNVPPLIFARMVANVLVEGTVGAVPLAGDAFDVMFRANRRNIALLREHFARVDIKALYSRPSTMRMSRTAPSPSALSAAW